ncbi:unnamed protein product, partial [Meganyctiphanes norvegica]
MNKKIFIIEINKYTSKRFFFLEIIGLCRLFRLFGNNRFDYNPIIINDYNQLIIIKPTLLKCPWVFFLIDEFNASKMQNIQISNIDGKSNKLQGIKFQKHKAKFQRGHFLRLDIFSSITGLNNNFQKLFMTKNYKFRNLMCGRKPIFLSSLVLMVVMGVGQAAITEYYTFTVARFVLGASLQGVFLVAYVMAMELVGKKYRVLVGVLAQAFYTIGYFTAAMLAYFIPDWRILQITMTLPALLFIPYYWFIPESSRWLIAKNRGAEARVNLIKAAKVNKKEVSDEILDQAVEAPSKENTESNFLDLFRTPNLRKKTINLFFNWFVNSGVYYGLSLNTGNLGGNAYLNFVISGAVEIPAHAITIILLDRVGRRLPLCGFMVLGGSALLCTMFIPEDLSWLIITLSMFGKLCITASYAVIYVFTAELFPTVVRNLGVGSSSMVARIGGALAPYINLLGDSWDQKNIFFSLVWQNGLRLSLVFDSLMFPGPSSIENAKHFEKLKIRIKQKIK